MDDRQTVRYIKKLRNLKNNYDNSVIIIIITIIIRPSTDDGHYRRRLGWRACVRCYPRSRVAQFNLFHGNTIVPCVVVKKYRCWRARAGHNVFAAKRTRRPNNGRCGRSVGRTGGNDNVRARGTTGGGSWLSVPLFPDEPPQNNTDTPQPPLFSTTVARRCHIVSVLSACLII